MTVWLDDAKLIQRHIQFWLGNIPSVHLQYVSFTSSLLPSSLTYRLLNLVPLHRLLDICFSPHADKNRPCSVCSPCTLFLLPQGSFWRRQTGILLMVQGTVWKNTSWIMERTVDVLQKAIVRQGCLTTASVPFKNGLQSGAVLSSKFKAEPSRVCAVYILVSNYLYSVKNKNSNPDSNTVFFFNIPNK